MNIKTIVFIALTASVSFASCGGSNEEKKDTTQTPPPAAAAPAAAAAEDAKGHGKFTNVELTHPIDAKMASAGEKVYDVKCASCHKLSDEKMVGPGWKGVTDRRSPEWIMNFVTNTDEMLDKDAEAQAMLEVCMVRMPNQNLSDQDARDILEFMRKNDGKN
ncbi:MAG: cytochrome c [Bacteroidetes bacterium]|nr:cytochrome c [Bacteroidota bacterium]